MGLDLNKLAEKINKSLEDVDGLIDWWEQKRSSKGLYQITLSYACFGIEVEEGMVVFAAPIAKWMVGKDLSYVEKWVKKKNGKIEKI
jgi:hypothetical protein